jgi:nucleoside-diphosphate-sugar epimerase
MILITGATGIVGRAVCKYLEEICIPYMPLTHIRKKNDPIGSLEADLTDEKVFEKFYFDNVHVIVHLAAAVPHDIKYPDTTLSANKTKKIDENIFKLQQLTGARVIYMSTCGLYDRNTKYTKIETDKLNATTPYFIAKERGEHLFNTLGNAVILRLSAPLGEGLKSHLVAMKFVRTVQSNLPIKIWGSGLREQDFIDVEDIASLIAKIILSTETGTFNVASGRATTMLDLAEKVVSVLRQGKIELTDTPDPNEGGTARFSIRKTKQIFDWMPKITLEQSIAKLASESLDKIS